MSVDLAVRAARAEIERDEAVKRAEIAEESLRAFMTKDEETMLDTLHIIGIPARDLRDIYEVVGEWQRQGGRPTWLDTYRELFELRKTAGAGEIA